MTYVFRFGRKRLAVVCACLTALLILSFAAGVVTGIVLWMPTQAEIAALRKSASDSAVAGAGSAATRPARPRVQNPPAFQQPAGLPAAKAAAGRAPAPVSAVPVLAAAVLPQPASNPPAPDPPPASSPASAAPAAGPSTDDDVFSVQLGSFRDTKNAQQLVSDLKQRGYSATLFSALDADQREWTVVRIPGFRTLADASKAAAAFTNRERLQALIRRSSGL